MNTNEEDKPGKPAKITTDPIVQIEILINGTLIDGFHHAVGKVMPLEKSKADVLASLKEPAVRIVGI